MQRYRGESYGDHIESQHHFRPSRGGPQSIRSSDGPMNHQQEHQHRGSPSSYRVPIHGDRRAFHSPPSFSPGTGGAEVGGFRPMDGGGGGGVGGYNSGYQMPPMAGQKRAYPFSGKEGGSPDQSDGGSFAKLFVGSVPRTVTEEDIRPVFEEHGNVLEVALIKDKRTGQPQGCCFIKYATSEDADRAIRALHNNYTLRGGIGPIQVRYADGERERLGTVEYKLFVGSLNKQASVQEIEEIFAPYGRVDDVYLMRDEMKQSRGCGFVKYPTREMALAAINALSGKFTMRGCDQPLIVRFADPKKPRFGESRVSSFGGPGSGPRFQAPGIRPPPTVGEPMHSQIAPNTWRPMAAPNPGPRSNPSIHGFGNQFPPRSNDMQVSSSLSGLSSSGDSSFPALPVSTSMSQQGGRSGSGDGSYPGLPFPSSMSQQSLNQPMVQNLSVGPQVSPLQKPIQSPQNLPSSRQVQQPMATPFTQAQNSHALPTQLHQVQMPAQQSHGKHGEFAMAQPQAQQTLPSAVANQQLPAQQPVQHVHQSPSQLAQMLSQQTQTLQASYQSSQQAFSQLQQQLQMMQPSNQNLPTQQGSHAPKQSSWPGPTQQAPAITSFQSPPPTSAAPATTQTIATLKCDWTEHTAPDGYKYYHNSVTGESKWEKPEELTLYEQQQMQKQQQQTKPSIQQPQMQAYPQGLSPQQAPQMQGQYQSPLQIQFRPPQQLQQTSQALSYQAPAMTGQRSNQEHSYAQMPHLAGSVNDPSRFQQGLHAGQEWMWKNKPAGT